MTMYGPMQSHVIALIDRASRLTHGEARELANAWDAAPKVTRGTAWDAPRAAAWDAAWDATKDVPYAAAWAAAYAATTLVTRDLITDTGYGAWYTVQTTVLALVVRDLIGQAWTQADYDELTGPWRRVIGPCHPDDAPLEMP